MIPRQLHLSLSLLVMLAGPAAAERIVRTIDVDPAPTVSEEGGITRSITRIDAPGVVGPAFLLRGQVRTEQVSGVGYLEMWSDLGAQGRYFSRTLGSAGPMRNLEGTQEWRAFALPFVLADAPAPSALELNVVLPGPGKVFLGRLELVQLESEEEVRALVGSAPRDSDSGGLDSNARFALGALLGGLAVAGFVLWKRRSARTELRRMSAIDAGGGLP